MKHQFRNDLFFEDAEKLHLTFDDTWIYSGIEDAQVRARLCEFVEYEPLFSSVLDEICAGVVGRTLFRIIATKSAIHMGGKKIKLFNYSGEVSIYSRKDFAVVTNRSMFDEYGNGLSSRQYYYISDDGEIATKGKTLAGALFHEFCHALHDIEKIPEITNLDELYRSNAILGQTWDSAEELRTITGCVYGQRYDPVCDHCFDLCDSIVTENSFHPRYSHKGYDVTIPPPDELAGRRQLRAYLSESKKIMEGWKKYVF
ncbi:MAG: hypothetical protein LBI34_00750 [Puniceicoccales bacterium]|jgi:hypothetical protein|nr:hypothetical protein [Puniceicoccales bacterium]